jgi:hypothetical protein
MDTDKNKSSDEEYADFIIVQRGVEMRLRFKRESMPKLTKAKVKRMLSEIISTLAIKITKEQN